MSTDTSSFDFKRTLPLKPARLWEVLTDPKHREHWGAPEEGMVLTVEASDLRAGGQDRHRCGPADAPDFVVETRWYDLTAPDRAVYTETVIIQGEPLGTSLVTYALSAEGDGTSLDVNVAISSFVGSDALGEFKTGWEGGMANLARYVADLSAA